MATSHRSFENELNLLNAYSESLENVLKIEKELTLLRRKSENKINSLKTPSAFYHDDLHFLQNGSINSEPSKVKETDMYTLYTSSDKTDNDTLNPKCVSKGKEFSPTKKNAIRLSISHRNNVSNDKPILNHYKHNLNTCQSNISAAFVRIANNSQNGFDPKPEASSELDKSIDKKADNLSVNLAKQLNELYTHIIGQYVKDEKLLAKYFDLIRNLREKIALSTVKSELVRLKMKKNQAVDPNYSLKKRQRSLLMKLQREYNDIKFMRDFQKKLSNDRKRILFRQLKHFKTMFTLNVNRKDFSNKFYLKNANISGLKENVPLKCYHKNRNEEIKILNDHKKKLNDLLLLHFDLQLNSAALNSIKHKYSNSEIVNVLKDFSTKSHKLNQTDCDKTIDEVPESYDVVNDRPVKLIALDGEISHAEASTSNSVIPSIMKIGHINMENVPITKLQKIPNKNKYLVQFHNHGDIFNELALKNKNIILKIMNGEGKLIQISFKNLKPKAPPHRAIRLNDQIQIKSRNIIKTCENNKLAILEKDLFSYNNVLVYFSNTHDRHTNNYSKFISLCIGTLKFSNVNLRNTVNNFFEKLLLYQNGPNQFDLHAILNRAFRVFADLFNRYNKSNAITDSLSDLEYVNVNIIRKFAAVHDSSNQSKNQFKQIKDDEYCDSNVKAIESTPIIKVNTSENILNQLREKHFDKEMLTNKDNQICRIKDKVTDSSNAFSLERHIRDKLVVPGLIPSISKLPKPLSQIDEAEELRKKQLAVELEIKALLMEQQKSQVPYFVVREIPDKPPPPYIPPSDDTKTSVGTSTDPIPITDTSIKYCEIEDIVKTCHENIWLPFMSKTYSTQSEADSVFQDTCKNKAHLFTNVFIFDLCNELYKSEYGDINTKKNLWEYKRSLLRFKKSNICQNIENLAKQNLGLGGPILKESMFINCAHKLQDHVDELLIRELQDEEPEWVNVEEYEVRLKNSLTEAILKSLIKDTVNEFIRMNK